MKDFRQLKVWEEAHQLVLAIYAATAGFPSEERFGLTFQIRRASASIPTNIAEGCGRVGDGEFQRFLQIAMGSVSEVDYQLLLARDLGFVNGRKYGELNG
jgi:four helix bundle protein